MFFFELIQLALGERNSLSHNPTEEEWQEAYLMAEKQALTGILFSAVEKLNCDNKAAMPPMELFYQWIGDALQIENRNKEVDYAAAQLTRIFKGGGMRSCVLKGQGIAQLYPEPERRQSGDVDLWVEGGRKKVLKFLKDNCLGTGQVVIHHVDARIIEGVDSEIHFMPGYTWNPFLHRKLQHFFRQQVDTQFSNYDSKLGFAYPTSRFNAVYILSHIYMHYLYEGVGLRQIIDYYYVLKNMTTDEREQAARDICQVGLKKFAGAVMYVLGVVCSMDKSMVLVSPDTKRGLLLLDEIMRGGNMGKYDVSLANRKEENLIQYNLVAFSRQLRSLRYYPMDVISIPFWKVWHWCWRICKGYLE